MKKFLVLLTCLTLVLGTFSACGAPSAQQPSTSEPQSNVESKGSDTPYVSVIALGFQHQFWQAVKSGADAAAKEYNVTITFEGPEQETMVDKQVDMLKTALGKNPIAVAMAAIDPESVRVDLEQAKSKGIAVVGFDSGCGEVATATCATDSYQAGVLAAENAAKLMNNKGKIGIIGHSQTMVDAVARVEGFVETIKKNYPDIKVVDTQYGDGDHLKSADIAKAMMQANPNINCFYTSNEGACVGAYNGLSEINKIGKVLIIGFDSSKALKDAIRKGEIAGAITQDPVGMGYKAVETAVKIARGEDIKGVIDTGCYWYDASNMDDEKIAPLLYD